MSARLVLTLAWKVMGVFWSVVSVAGAGRDLEHVARVAVERDRVGAVAVGRDGDRAGVAVQRRFVVRIERLAADGERAAPRPEVDRAVRRGDRGRAGEVGR